MKKPTKPGWLMTEAQHALYFRLWNAVCRKMCWDVLPAAERDEWRRELHRRAFGEDKSAKHIKAGQDFDRILGVFNSYLRPGDLRGALVRENMSRARTLWSFEHQLVPRLAVLLHSKVADDWEAKETAIKYIETICEGKFNTRDFFSLEEKPMQQLWLTVSERIAKMRQKAGLTEADLDRRAGLSSTDPAELSHSDHDQPSEDHCHDHATGPAHAPA